MPRRNSYYPSDDDLESSPDPLAASLNSRPSRGRPSRRQQKEALIPTSANAQRRNPDRSSPSKSVSLHTAGAPGASPWRIKVTVEAEPGYEGSPTRQPKIRTRTTTVPLKEADDYSPVKRRGRPRKSDATASTKPKRSGTPVKRKPRSRKSDIAVEDETEQNNDDTTDIGAPTPPRRQRRGRAQKDIPSDDTVEQVDDETNEPESIPQNDEVVQEETEAEQQQQQQPLANVQDSAVPEKRDPFAFTKLTPLYIRHSHFLDTLPPRALGTPSADSLKLVQNRKSTPRKPAAEQDSLAPIQSNMPAGPQTNVDKRVISISSTEEVDSYEDSEAGGVLTPSDDEEDIRPTSEFLGPEYSMVDPEGFSMVSVESLESYRAVISSPVAEPSSPRSKHGVSIMPAIPPSPELPTAERLPAMLSTTNQLRLITPVEINSSPPVARLITPDLPIRSTSKPPPLQIPTIPVEKPTTPRLGRVVRAGIALQGVLDPEQDSNIPGSSNSTSEQRRLRLDDIFSGFGENTRRELRAGLRLGEQLAQRARERSRSAEPEHPPADISISRVPEATTNRDFNAQNPPTHGSVGYPRLPTPDEKSESGLAVPQLELQLSQAGYPKLGSQVNTAQLISPARSDSEMSWSVDTPPVAKWKESVTSSNSSQNNNSKLSSQLINSPSESPNKSSGVLNNTLVDLWQEEVMKPRTRKTRPKKPSGSDLNDTLSDLWGEEASRSSVLPEKQTPQEREKSPELVDLFAEDSNVFKPRRAKLPRTWRRTSANNFNYSDEIVPEEHGFDMAKQNNTDQSTEEQVAGNRENTSRHTPESMSGSSPISEVPSHNEINMSSPSIGSPPVSSSNNSHDLLESSQIAVDYPTNHSRTQMVPLRPAGPSGNHSQIDSSMTGHSLQKDTTLASDVQQLYAEIDAQQLHYSRGHSSVVEESAIDSTINSRFSKVSSDQPQSSGLFSRLTSSIWPFKAAPVPLPMHQVAAKYNSLPKVEPWTKTHYKTLDSIFQLSKRSPALFDTSVPENTALLARFPNKDRLIGAQCSSWGYELIISEKLIVMAAIFMQLLSLDSAEEYKAETGTEIDIGKGHNPGNPGDAITEEIVVKRLFTIVVGEWLRRDERKGIKIDRTIPLKLVYAN